MSLSGHSHSPQAPRAWPDYLGAVINCAQSFCGVDGRNNYEKRIKPEFTNCCSAAFPALVASAIV
jgi:hypothetical protein